MIIIDSIIKKEWVKEIISYQEDRDSDASDYYTEMINSTGLTFRELSTKMFKKAYPGSFRNFKEEKLYYDNFIESIEKNLINHLNKVLTIK